MTTDTIAATAEKTSTPSAMSTPAVQKKHTRARIGIFNVGFHRYWPQFPGLREELDGYRTEFENTVRNMGVDVISGGLVDTVETGRVCGDLFARENVDLIICFVTTYVQSAFVVPVAQRGNAHMILVGLQPTKGMDVNKVTTHLQLVHDNCTSLPEIMYALRRCGLRSDSVFGTMHDDPRSAKMIEEWVYAAKAVHALRNARIGLLGHPFEGMLDMNVDPTSFTAAFGMHIDMIEMGDLQKRVDDSTEDEIAAMIRRIEDFFTFPQPGSDKAIAGLVTPEAMRNSARVAIGLEKLVLDFNLDGLSHYYRGLNGNNDEMLIASIIVGASLLTAKGIPVAGEGDLKNCTAMLIMDRLDSGGSFCELHPADFNGDFVFIGHDGPGHIGISNEQPALRGLNMYHGKFGSGVSVEFKVKNGPITIAGLTVRENGKFALIVAEGESLPGDIPQTGNTNTRAKFNPDMPSFVENWTDAGVTHHFALGVGHTVGTWKKIARIVNMEIQVVAQ
jgi:L-arabinose isomerase